jgi:hypothetical protein
MEDILARTWEQLIGRQYGPLTFRLVVQPLVAVFFGLRSGLRDARERRPAYLHTALKDPSQRRELARQGWEDVGRVFVLAIAFDVIYQLIVFRWVYPVQSLIVGVVLAIVPYVIVRGVANRVARRSHLRA